MKLPIGFIGKVNAKVIKLYNDPYDVQNVLDRMDDKILSNYTAIVSDQIILGGWKYTYLSNDNISLDLVYNEKMDWYESMNTNLPNVYLVKIM